MLRPTSSAATCLPSSTKPSAIAIAHASFPSLTHGRSGACARGSAEVDGYWTSSEQEIWDRGDVRCERIGRGGGGRGILAEGASDGLQVAQRARCCEPLRVANTIAGAPRICHWHSLRQECPSTVNLDKSPSHLFNTGRNTFVKTLIIIGPPRRAKTYKREDHLSAIPQLPMSQSQEALYHHSPLPLISAMLFHKPLFSFVVAFAAASSVVASAIPVARNDPNQNKAQSHRIAA